MQEATKKTTTRRDLMGAAGFTALAGIAAVSIAKPDAQAVEVIPAAHDPDAPLLALCGRYLTLQAGVDATYAREEKVYRSLKRRGASYEQLHAVEAETEAERTPLYNEQIPLLDRIAELPAATLAGQQARARVLMAWYALGKDGGHGTAIDWCHFQPLFRDLLGEAV